MCVCAPMTVLQCTATNTDTSLPQLAATLQREMYIHFVISSNAYTLDKLLIILSLLAILLKL